MFYEDEDDAYRCIDGNGDEWPEHYDGGLSYVECIRCGAQLDA